MNIITRRLQQYTQSQLVFHQIRVLQRAFSDVPFVDNTEKTKKYNITFTEKKRDNLQDYIFNENKHQFIMKKENESTMFTKIKNACKTVEMAFLPKGYPKTVNGKYLPYCIWTAISWVFSSAGGVLSMQSLLTAVGLGSGSAPLAAGLNWVIKDGLGQFGGVLFATIVSTHLDSSSRSWRFLAALALEVSTWLEVLTPLFPRLFIPMAAIANMGKNISWLAGSATRAGIRYGFINAANMSDITAKEGSQSTMSTLIGTCFGIVMSPYICINRSYVLATSFILSLCSLYCLHKALTYVELPTINKERGFHITESYIQHATIPSIYSVSQKDSIYLPFATSVDIPIHIGTSFQKVIQSISTNNDLINFINMFENHNYIMNVKIHNNQSLNNPKNKIYVALDQKASSQDQLFSYLHTFYFRQELLNSDSSTLSNQDSVNILIQKSLLLTKEHFLNYNELLNQQHWNLQNIFIEEKQKRYSITFNTL